MESSLKDHDQYEERLYSVFKTFDVDNEEALDENAVSALCSALHLGDRGDSLTKALFPSGGGRASFAKFRSALLAVLADPVPITLSDDDSSGQEMPPVLVLRDKKYGRRSRPQRHLEESPVPRASSESRLSVRNRPVFGIQRCASALDSRDCDRDSECQLDSDRQVDADEAFDLCRQLSMENIDPRLVKRTFEASGCTQMPVGEFFERLDAALTKELRDPIEDSDEELAGTIADAWVRGGVERPLDLLSELGFRGAALHLMLLERALADALGSTPGSIRLASAALALGSLRAKRARMRYRSVIDERDRLRMELAEASRRASDLAIEVDECQSRLEDELQQTRTRYERRAEESKRAAATKLEEECTRRLAERDALLAEATRAKTREARADEKTRRKHEEAEELRARLVAEEERTEALTRHADKLVVEIEALKKNACESAAEAEAAQRQCNQLKLHAQDLEKDRAELADRADELAAALERNTRIVPEPSPPSVLRATSWRDETSDFSVEECDISLVSDAEGSTQTTTTAMIQCPGCSALSLSKLHLEDTRVEMETQTDYVELTGNTNLTTNRSECSSQTDDGYLSDKTATEDVNDLKKQLEVMKVKHDEEKLKLSNFVNELELSLEQLKMEYDKCEDYWNSKLEDERVAHDAEMSASDQRLVDLASKITDYERQFSGNGRLPVVAESACLEAQITEVEEEFALYRRTAEAKLDASECEVERLREEVERLSAAQSVEQRPNTVSVATNTPPQFMKTPCASCERWVRVLVAGRQEAAEMRQRVCCAEASVKRLQERLCEADLLVKDLYLDTCHFPSFAPSGPL